MTISNQAVPENDLLRIPRRQWLGRWLEAVSWLPGIAKIQRVRRKRFIARIKSPDHRALIQQVLRDPSGRSFQAALNAWTRESAPRVEPPKSHPRAEICSRRCSVVINTVDRAMDLALTLASLHKIWDHSRDELIIVLGPTGDDSEDVIRRSAMPCRLIHCPQRNLAVSRNLGWLAACGQYVAFIDDDASPADGWLDSLLEPLARDSKVGISAGFVMDGEGKRFLNRYVVADTLGRAFWFSDATAATAKVREIGSHRAFLTATGCNMAFRRSALDDIGGFDPFYRYFLEETDGVLRVIAAGFQCVAAPASRVFHRLGANLVRKPEPEIANRIQVIRSQIHYIGKFGKATFPLEEIENCLWQRALLDLEKIAWDSGPKHACGDLQREYLLAVANEFRLDSSPESSTFSAQPAVQSNASS